MTALFAGNLLHLGQAPRRAMRCHVVGSAWNQALPVLASIVVHASLAVTAMVHDFSPTGVAAEPMFRKGQTASTSGANVRLVKLTLEGDGFNQGRVRIEPLDASPPAPSLPAVEHAKAPQPVREPVPTDAGHAQIEPARLPRPDEGGPSLAVRGIGRGSPSTSTASFIPQPLASAMISATEHSPPAPPAPAPADRSQAENTTVTHVTVTAARSPPPVAAIAPMPLPEALPIEPAEIAPPAPNATAQASRSDAPTPAARGDDSAPGAQARAAQPAGVADGTDRQELPTPIYPAEARRRGEQGTVVLEIEVLADGKVGTIRVIESPGHPRLVQAAIDAARRATFKPTAIAGAPAARSIRVPFHFEIR